MSLITENFIYPITREEYVGDVVGKINYNYLAINSQLCQLSSIGFIEPNNLYSSFISLSGDIQSYYRFLDFKDRIDKINDAVNCVQILSSYWAAPELTIHYPFNVGQLPFNVLTYQSSIENTDNIVNIAQEYIINNFDSQDYENNTKINIVIPLFSKLPDSAGVVDYMYNIQPNTARLSATYIPQIIPQPPLSIENSASNLLGGFNSNTADITYISLGGSYTVNQNIHPFSFIKFNITESGQIQFRRITYKTEIENTGLQNITYDQLQKTIVTLNAVSTKTASAISHYTTSISTKTTQRTFVETTTNELIIPYKGQWISSLNKEISEHNFILQRLQIRQQTISKLINILNTISQNTSPQSSTLGYEFNILPDGVEHKSDALELLVEQTLYAGGVSIVSDFVVQRVIVKFIHINGQWNMYDLVI